MENSNENKSDKELFIHRIFDAPREMVWKAFTDPEMTKLWFGPRTFTTPYSSIDLRVGGKYVNCMRSPDGADYWSTGEYKEIVPFEKFVMTDSFADEHGNVVNASYYGMNPEFPMESIVTFTFEDLDDKTGFAMRYEDANPIPDDDLINMTAGWNESIDKLAEYFAQIV